MGAHDKHRTNRRTRSLTRVSSPIDLPGPIDDGALDADPHRQFARWFEHAHAAGVHEPEAMCLATATPDGRPSARMVLLRGSGPDGYCWYTNYESRKGHELAANPHAALTFHWATVGRQIRIEGTVTRTSAADSDAYFDSRHPASRIGAWASAQSTPIGGRAELEDHFEELARRFGDGPIPRPPYWGGHRLRAEAFEFWQHGDSRLHDRFRYELGPDGWTLTRLSP